MYKIMKIYYDKVTGEIIWNVSYNQEMTVNFDRDYETINVLNERSKESLSLMILKDGEFAEDFLNAQLVKVDITTGKLVFSHPDPNEPGLPPVYQESLTEQIGRLRKENVLLKGQISASDNRADFHEEVLAEIILTISQ